MKYLDVRWSDFFERLDEWDDLRFESKRAFLALKPATPLPAHALEPAARRELVAAGWVEEYQSGFRIPEERREFSRAMRALDRVPVLDAFALDEVDPTTMLDRYFKEHLTLVERQQLSGDPYRASAGHFAKRAGSSRWLEEFLQLTDSEGGARLEALDEPTEGGERVRLEQRVRRLSTHSSESIRMARELVLVLLEEQRPTTIEGALDLFDDGLEPDGGGRRSTFGEALNLLLNEALVLASLDAGTMPQVGLWEPAARTLARRTALANEPLETDRPRELIQRPLIIEDLVLLLHECTLEPPRVKADRFELFARSAKQLEERLLPLPSWLAREGTIWEADQRVVASTRRGLRLGLVGVAGTPGKDQRMVPSELGAQFLGWTDRERLSWLIESMRSHQNGPRYEEDDEAFLARAEGESPPGVALIPEEARSPHFWGVEMLDPALAAFSSAATDSFQLLGPFLERRVIEDNPYRSKVSRRYSWITEEDADQAWLAGLSVFFFNRLVGLGAVSVGESPLGYCFRLTTVGRYLFGHVDDFDLGELAEEANVIVQPNLELVFLSPSASARLACGAFAEATSALERGDSVGTLYRLTRSSVQRAAAAGLDADRVLATLRGLSPQDIPANVEAQIRAWLGAVRWARSRRPLILEVDDGETAARVVAAVGSEARLLSETVVEVGSWDSVPAAMRRKLVEAGIFVLDVGLD